MKRKFVKALLFGAMVFAASPVFVGCTDYDDDIERLQGEIDKINGGAPVSQAELTAAIDAAKRDLEAAMEQAVSGKADDASVVALREKVDALELALAGKGDASEINSLIEQIQGLQEAVNNVPGSLDALKAELEGKIAELESQIGAGSDNEEAMAEITKLRNELQDVKKMAENNAGAITELQQSLSKITALEGKVSALETASNTYKQDIATIKSDIATINNTLGTLATKADLATKVTLAEVNTAIETYLGKSSAEVKAALAKITELENYKNNVLAGAIGKLDKVSGEDLGKLSQALTDISTLKNQYTDLLNADKVGSIAAQLKALNAQYGTLETQISELGIAVKAMIQSISYIPEYKDGEVRFKSLWFAYPKSQPTKKIQVIQSTTQSLKFRVSPAAAAQTLVDEINGTDNKKYAISFLGESVKTRGASSDYVDIVSAKNNGNGVIELKVNASSKIPTTPSNYDTGVDKYYSLCMNVVAVTPEGEEKVEDNLTNISSDYFIMNVHSDIAAEVFLGWDQTSEKNTLLYDDANGFDLWKNVNNLSLWKTTGYKLRDISNDEKPLLYVEFYLKNEADKEFFEIEGSTLKMKADKVGKSTMVGKTVEVSRKISFKGFEDKFMFDHTVGGAGKTVTITVKENVEEQVVNMGVCTPDYTEAFAKDADMVAVQNATGLTNNEYTARFGSNGNGNVTYTYKYVKDSKDATGVQFVFESDKLTLKVDQYTQIKDAIIAEATFKVSDLKVVKVKATVNPSTMPDALTTIKRSGQWDGNNVEINLPVTLKDGRISAVSLVPDLSGLYENYAVNKKKLEAMKGAFTVTLANAYGAVLSDNMQEFDLNAYNYPVKNFKPMEIVAKTTLNGEKKDENKGSINLTKFGGTVEVTKTSVTFTKADLASTFNLNEGMTWKDYLGNIMWKDGVEYRYDEKTNKTSKYDMNDILAAYRLTAPEFTFKDATNNNNQYFDLKSNGKVSLTAAGQSVLGATPITTKVIATFKAPWGNINGTTAKEVNSERVYTVELTVVLGGK